MKNRRITRLAAILFGLMALFFVAVDVADGQPNRRRKQVYTVEIPEKSRPWAGKPWVVGIVLGVGAVLISLKNAKRTHLD
jgi:hypothetical protein